MVLLLPLILPVALAALLLGFSDGRQATRVAVAGGCVELVLLLNLVLQVHRQTAVVFGSYFRADGLTSLFLLSLAFVFFVTLLYSVNYLKHVPPGRFSSPRWFYCLLFLFVFAMLAAYLAQNLGLLWIMMEATTLASALLVSFYQDARAIEAGYKYLLLLTVGITSAFFGCVLLYSAAQPHLGAESALLITNLRRVAGELPPHIALIATLLLLVGFGIKAGLAPFHPWVADAHAEAPAPMSAFLSSVIIKVPFIGILRVWSIFGSRYPELNDTLMVLGAFTLVVGGALAVAQDDLKRMFAYSSVAQVGYIAVALGTGSYLGCYAAVLFVVSHALTKALLFMGAGAVAFAARDIRSMASLGGLARRMPLTAACVLAGVLSLAGMPPFSGFVAKAGVVLAAAEAHAWVVMAVALAASLFTMAYGIAVAGRVFRGPGHSSGLEEAREVPAPMGLAMLLLALASLVIGLGPGLLHPLLDLAGLMQVGS